MDDNDETSYDVSAGLEYIRRSPQVTNVLLTGGDPLLLAASQLGVEATGVDGDRHFVNLVREGDGVVARDRSNAVIARSPGADSRDIAVQSVRPESVSGHYVR